jgi:ketosteroid isomerase-like protein
MTQESIDFVKGVLDRAREDPNAMYEALAEDVEWDVRDLELLDRSNYRGRDGVREFFRDWVGAFEEWSYEAEEFIAADEATVVRIRQWGRGRGSGAAVEVRFWQVWTVEEGQVTRATHHLHKAQALRAAGLSA